MMFDRYDRKAVFILAEDYSAFDLADHLADVMPETLADGRSLWDLSAHELAVLASAQHPDGATGLQCRLEGI